MTLPLLFGANVDPMRDPADGPLRHTLAAERLGLDLVTIQDHPPSTRRDHPGRG